MTTDLPADLPAGPELDRLVHERVMGLPVGGLPAIPPFDSTAPLDIKPGKVFLAYGAAARFVEVPAYSTDIADAHEVAAHLKGWTWGLSMLHGGGFQARFEQSRDGKTWGAFADAPTVPLAICRAALAAVASP